MAAIDLIDEDDWADTSYLGSRAQVADAEWDRWRLIWRRTVNESDQPRCWTTVAITCS